MKTTKGVLTEATAASNWYELGPGNTFKITDIRLMPADVVIPEGVRVIDEFDFRQEDKIESIVFPDSCTWICGRAFFGCKNLKHVTFGHGDQLEIGSYAFAECTSLESIEIPDNVTRILEDTFAGCTSLKSAVIGNGLSSLSSETFKGCTNLVSVTIGDKVEKIFERVFFDCKNLKSVKLGKSVSRIYTGAFARCESLTDIEFPQSLVNISSMAFFGTGLRSLTIPKSVTRISSRAFEDCNALSNIFFDDTAGVEICHSAFGEQSNITSIIATTQSNVNLQPHTLESCTKLELLVLPNVKVTDSTIDEVFNELFENCDKYDLVVKTMTEEVADCCERAGVMCLYREH